MLPTIILTKRASVLDIFTQHTKKAMEHIQTIIFDMDGVIADSEHLHLEAEQAIFQQHGIEAPEMQIGDDLNFDKRSIYYWHVSRTPRLPERHRVCVSVAWATPGDSLRSTTGVLKHALLLGKIGDRTAQRRDDVQRIKQDIQP